MCNPAPVPSNANGYCIKVKIISSDYAEISVSDLQRHFFDSCRPAIPEIDRRFIGQAAARNSTPTDKSADRSK
jgi:hypothetical protein